MPQSARITATTAVVQTAPTGAVSVTRPNVGYVQAPTTPATATSPTSAAQAQRTSDTQTLRALYDVASNYDGSYRAALAQVRANEAAVGQALAALLPQIGLQADAQRNRAYGNAQNPFVVGGTAANPVLGYAAAGSYTQRDAGINATQPLYRPASKIAWDQSKRQLKAAQAQLAATQQDLTVRLAQAYFDVLAAQDTLRYLRTLKDSVSRQLDMARRNFEIGNANVTDSREAQARLAMTRAQEIGAENDLHIKQLALDQLVGQTGVQPRPLVKPANLPAPGSKDANGWATGAVNTPAVQQARLALEVARLEVKKANTGHLPTLDVQATLARAQYPNGNPTGSGAWSGGLNPYLTTLATIGVQLNWPLFSGGAVLARQHETQALQDKAQAQLDSALRNSAQATRAAYFTLQSSLERVQALETAEESSRTALQANQLGYKVGARTNIDVLNAQSQLFEAQRDLARARYDTLVGLLRLKQAAGILAVGDLAQIDTLLARSS